MDESTDYINFIFANNIGKDAIPTDISFDVNFFIVGDNKILYMYVVSFLMIY